MTGYSSADCRAGDTADSTHFNWRIKPNKAFAESFLSGPNILPNNDIILPKFLRHATAKALQMKNKASNWQIVAHL